MKKACLIKRARILALREEVAALNKGLYLMHTEVPRSHRTVFFRIRMALTKARLIRLRRKLGKLGYG